MPYANPSDPGPLILPDAEATARFGAELAHLLAPGSVILLEGALGAGKTALTRALVTARLEAAGAPPEEVPSPTFSLVQIYQAGAVEIWHCDLYRLGNADELVELGFDEAFGAAICLIEWPDRLGSLAPPDALTLRLEHLAEGRRVQFVGGWPVAWVAALRQAIEGGASDV